MRKNENMKKLIKRGFEDGEAYELAFNPALYDNCAILP
jgi:hypothetical protein